MSRARALTDPELTVQDVEDLLCRHVDAAMHGGFDGKEHPEHRRIVNMMIGALYPVVTLENITATFTRHFRQTRD